MFIAVDGIDGAGKTTLVRQLAEAFGPPVLVTKEPTDSSKWGQRLREAAVKGRLPRAEELDYFHRDRLWHIENVIQPALNTGDVVITDRYVDSTLAFQAIDPGEADDLYQKFRNDILIPDVTFILDCPVDLGLKRIISRNSNISAFENVVALSRAARIYEARSGENYVHLNASGTPQYTYDQARNALYQKFDQALDEKFGNYFFGQISHDGNSIQQA